MGGKRSGVLIKVYRRGVEKDHETIQRGLGKVLNHMGRRGSSH